MRKVAIIGGGIAGLTATFRLLNRDPPFDVKLLEREASAGGLIQTLQLKDRRVELGPNGFLDSKPQIVSLCKELGLQLEHADPQSAERFVTVEGRLCRVPKSPGEFLKSDALSIRGKIRFLAERLIGKPTALEDESIADFGRRHFGAEATEKLLDAVVTGVYAGDMEMLSIRSCFPKLVEMEARFGSLLKAQGALAKEKRQRGEQAGLGTLTCPVGGMGRLTHRLSERVGSSLQTGVEVQRIGRNQVGWSIESRDHSWNADAVILAVPARVAAELIDDMLLKTELAAIADVSAVVVALSYKREALPSLPKGFGFIIPERLGHQLLGVIFSSNIFPNQAPADEFAVRAILGGERRRDITDWDDPLLVGTVRDEMRSLLGIAAEPTFTFVHRWKHAIPQYHVGHEARLRRIDESLKRLPGLFLTGASYRGVAVADCIKDGMAVAEQAAHYLNQSAQREPSA